MPPTRSDLDFTTYAAKGCPAAFGRLVERHLPAVQATAGRVLGAYAEQASDVTQAVFILLARKAKRLPSGIVVSAWLHRQAVRLALNTVRSEKRRLHRETQAAMLSVMNSPAPSGLWLEIQPHVDQAMQRLSEQDQAALALRFFEKKGLAEIGTALGIGTDAAQKRIERALEKLRGRLAKHLVQPLSITVLAVMMAVHGSEAAMLPAAKQIASNALAALPAGSLVSTAMLLFWHTKAMALGCLAGVSLGGLWWGVSAARASVSPVAAPQADTRKPAAKEPKKVSAHPALPALPTRLSLEAVFDKLQELLKEPENEMNRLRMRATMEALAPEDFEGLAKLIKQTLGQNANSRLLKELAHAWALKAPSQALFSMIQESRHAETLPQRVFDVWHASDPAAAQQWLVEHQDEAIYAKVIPSFIRCVATSLVAESEANALHWAAQLSGNEYQTAALEPLWTRFTRSQASDDHSADMNRLFKLLSSHADPAFTRLAVREFCKDWAQHRVWEYQDLIARQQPGEIAWVAALAYLSVEGKIERGATGVGNFRDGDIAQRAAAVLHLAPNRTISQAVAEMIPNVGWMSPGFRKWALPLLDGPERNQAILDGVQRSLRIRSWTLGDTAEHEQALVWAAAHPDEKVRDPLIYGIYQKWLGQVANPQDDPKIFLSTCGWPAPLLQILEKAAAER